MRVIELIEHVKADRVLVEKAASGHALFDDLFYAAGYRGKIVPITPDLPKEIRVEQATAELETGRFLLPSEALWLLDFERECRAFPAARHDDQVDSLAQFVNWQKGPHARSLLNRKPSGNVPSRRISLKQRIQDRYRNHYD